MSLLSIDKLSLALPASADRPYAIRDLSLSIKPGETLCVVGESGSGKSMTALATMGLLPKTICIESGSIMLDGCDLLSLTPKAMRAIRGQKIAMIFQQPMTSLNPVMRIADQILETFEAHGALDRRCRTERTIELIDEVGLPDPRSIARAYPHELSGGQRQRIMIAIALAMEPNLIIADEPTTALDVTTQAQILRLLNDLRRRHGTAVLFITHDFGVVSEIADRVVVLKTGRLVEQGSVTSVLRNPQHPYTRSLLAAVPSMAPPKQKDLTGAPQAMRVTNLTKSYDGGRSLRKGREIKAVQDASFSIRRGETLGLVGESGSGKSTLGRCLLRLIEPDSGQVEVGDLTVTNMSHSQFRPFRRRLQMIFQDPFASLNPRLSVGQIVAEGPFANGLPKTEALKHARQLLELVSLTPESAIRYPHQFSGGQRQRIAIARALALDPEILIADEPVSALDVSIQAQILDLLKTLQAKFGLAILFITHDLRVAAQMCDRIAVMQREQIVEMKPTLELFTGAEHDYTKALLAAIPGAHMKPVGRWSM